MFKAKLKIKYKDDWSNRLHEKFNCELEFLHTHNLENKKVLDIFRIKYKNLKEKEIIDLLKSYSNIEKIEIFDKKENSLIIKLITNMSNNSNNEIFIKYDCFKIGSIKFKDEAEIWTIFSNSKENISNLVKEIKKLEDREITLLSLKNYDLEYEDLTEKQSEILNYLDSKGYFEIPRRITLEKASESLNMSSANLNKHLMRATKKLVKNQIN